MALVIGKVSRTSSRQEKIRLSALKLVYIYLTNHKQKVKVSLLYSTLENIPTGIPQGPVLGPLLLNTFINDLFYTD